MQNTTTMNDTATQEMEVVDVDVPVTSSSTTTTTSQKPTKLSAAQLQRLAKANDVRSSQGARKLVMDYAKDHTNYSSDTMEQMWMDAIAVAQNGGKKTVQECDVSLVLKIVEKYV